jgi:hypothetical protein
VHSCSCHSTAVHIQVPSYSSYTAASISFLHVCPQTAPQAAQSRLDALENDNPDDAPDPFGLGAGDDDDEFVMEESEEDGELYLSIRAQ